MFHLRKLLHDGLVLEVGFLFVEYEFVVQLTNVFHGEAYCFAFLEFELAGCEEHLAVVGLFHRNPDRLGDLGFVARLADCHSFFMAASMGTGCEGGSGERREEAMR